MNDNPWVQIAKFGVIAMIWAGVLVFGIALSGNMTLSSADSSPMVGMGIAAFICAAVATGLILNPWETESAKKEQKQDAAEAAKRKNEHKSAIDPLSLLTDQDLEDLRLEIKENLRRRLIDGDDQAVSFEALLSEQEQRRRR